MKNYYYSKELKAIIPFDKVLRVYETEYSKETIVTLGTHISIELKVGEDEEFRKAYIEWLEKDNTGK